MTLQPHQVLLSNKEVGMLKSYLNEHLPHIDRIYLKGQKIGEKTTRWLFRREPFTGCYDLTVIPYSEDDDQYQVTLTRTHNDNWGIHVNTITLNKFQHQDKLHLGKVVDWVSDQQKWLNQLEG